MNKSESDMIVTWRENCVSEMKKATTKRDRAYWEGKAAGYTAVLTNFAPNRY